MPSLPADVGSIAKPATAIAVLALAEQGKLSLDDPLAKWIADVPQDKASITLHQLLLHQSGLAEYVADTNDYTSIGQADAVRAILSAPLNFAPGSSWSYSNPAFNLLAVVVEKASGRPYFEALQTLVFTPAGVNASFDPSSFPIVADVRKDDKWTDLRQAAAPTSGPFWTLWGAGGLYMSAEDLALFMRAFMAGMIVSPAAVLEARRPAVPLDANNAGGLAFGLVKRDDRWVYYFNGMGESGSADVWGDPDTRKVLAITANSSKPHAVAAGRKLTRAVLVSPESQ